MSDPGDDAQAALIRSVLREHGHDVPVRGRLSAQHRRAYEELTGEAAADGPGPGGDERDGPGVTEADPAGLAPAPAERPPARPRRKRRGLLGGVTGQGRTGPHRAAPRRPRKARERVSLERLVSRGYGMVGRTLGSLLPATGRCMQMQAGLAGIVLEDAIRETVVDPWLQPLARLEGTLENVGSLVLTPVCVAGLEMAQGLPPDERQLREAFLLPVLRECLVQQLLIEGDHAEQMALQVAQLGPLYAKAETMLAAIFTPPDAAAAAAAAAGGAPAAADPVAEAQRMAGV